MNGLTKETWVSFWKPELEKEAGLIFDALSDMHKSFIEHPVSCRRKFVTKNQAIIALLALLALDKAVPMILKML
jgi:hypothetical protein